MDEKQREIIAVQAEFDQDMAAAIQSISALGTDADKMLKLVWDAIQLTYKDHIFESMSRFAQIGFRHVMLTMAGQNTGGEPC